MWSVCINIHLHVVLVVPPWKHNSKLSLSSFFPCNPITSTITNFLSHRYRCSSSFKDDSLSSSPNQIRLGYDPSEDLFGLDVDIPPRDMKSEIRSWFGPNGQYIRELPCPSCRGRGYAPCSECGIDRSRQDCSLCCGKGIITCQRCLGERVIWEELVDEKPWEKARSSSPLKVEEDDEVDNLDLKLDARKRSKRVYRPHPPEVRLKISQSLKSLNAKTGMLSERMKMIYRDPTLRAQRLAAAEKGRWTPALRKQASETMKAFFSNPENRLKRSIAMKGVIFFCKTCGREGHRSSYCPERGENIYVYAPRKCGLCNKQGHNRRTCLKPRITKPKKSRTCRTCGQLGHNSRTCTLKTKIQSNGAFVDSLKDSRRSVRIYRCGVCGQGGHNSRSCSLKTNVQSVSTVTGTAVSVED